MSLSATLSLLKKGGSTPPVAPAQRKSRPKAASQRKTLISLILSLLTPSQIDKLRARYSFGKETIAELSKISLCPPVLLYSVLSPVWVKTELKLRLLRAEKQVVLLHNKGYTNAQIAKETKLPLDTVQCHTDDRFHPEMFLARPWYHDKAPKPPDPNELIYDEASLPPVSRLGRTDGILTDIPEERRGWCPSCGHLVSMPCLACRVKRDMLLRQIPKAKEFDPAEEEDEIEPELMFV
jgi:hypothetical protein